MKNKGLAFDIIVYALIAIVSVGLLILIASGTVRDTMNRTFCNAYLNVLSLLPRPGEGEVTIPHMCRFPDDHLEVDDIDDTSQEHVSKKIAAHSISCLEDARRKNIREDITCYQLNLEENVEEPVTEQTVTESIKNENLCHRLQNEEYDCGSENQLLWDVEGYDIQNQTIIMINYKYMDNAVEVVA